MTAASAKQNSGPLGGAMPGPDGTSERLSDGGATTGPAAQPRARGPLIATRRNKVRALRWLAVPLVLFVLVTIFGPMFYEFDPVAVNVMARSRPPLTRLADGSMTWLGTDQLGRDILGQLLLGARVSLLVGVATIVIGGGAGTVLGAVAGYAGKTIDNVIMRLADIQLSIPPIVLAILLMAVLGQGVSTLIITLSITRWARFARIARSAAISVKERDFVMAGRALGARSPRILRRHVIPFLWSPLVVVATLEVGSVIIAEAALSFLGLGTSAHQPSWGLVMANGRSYLSQAWWISTFPGVALSLVVVSIALFGDQLRDILDPKGLSR